MTLSLKIDRVDMGWFQAAVTDALPTDAAAQIASAKYPLPIYLNRLGRVVFIWRALL